MTVTLRAKWAEICAGCTVISLNPNESQEFGYSGSEQGLFFANAGYYKFEVYGAQGADANSSQVGGKGGYAYGAILVNANSIFHVFVGGTGGSTSSPNSYPLVYTSRGNNGGGAGSAGADSYYQYSLGGTAGGGGGATHITKGSIGRGELSYYDSYRSEIVIVAGGGGGGFRRGSNYYWNVGSGGTGGGTSGGNGTSDGQHNSAHNRHSYGATQSAGGSCSAGSTGETGSFGRAGDVNNGGGGGGGFYGGGSCMYDGGGGGSGYLNTSLLISGTTGMSNGVLSGNGLVRITYLGTSI